MKLSPLYLRDLNSEARLSMEAYIKNDRPDLAKAIEDGTDITIGGAEYLCSSPVEGTEEGSFDSKYIVRIDGDITKDAELNVKD